MKPSQEIKALLNRATGLVRGAEKPQGRQPWRARQSTGITTKDFDTALAERKAQRPWLWR